MILWFGVSTQYCSTQLALSNSGGPIRLACSITKIWCAEPGRKVGKSWLNHRTWSQKPLKMCQHKHYQWPNILVKTKQKGHASLSSTKLPIIKFFTLNSRQRKGWTNSMFNSVFPVIVYKRDQQQGHALCLEKFRQYAHANTGEEFLDSQLYTQIFH